MAMNVSGFGLSDAEEEGKWKWHSGEPVTYTNWSPYHPENGNTETRDYVMTDYFDRRWKVVGKSFGRTILEKAIHAIHFTAERELTSSRFTVL